MRLTRARSFLAAGLAVAACGATAAVLVAGPASAKPAAPASPHPVVLVACPNGSGQVKPSTYDIRCMPSQEFISGLSWTSWKTVAFGSGTLKVNNCTPSCAQGKYVKYPILVVLWRAQPWPSHPGRLYFSRLTWIFTAKRPSPVHTAAQTFILPS
jgi:hypothetical protein